MVKRTLAQIEETLRKKLSEAGAKDSDGDGIPDDVERKSLLGRDVEDPLGVGRLGQPVQIDFGIGGTGRGSSASIKPKVSHAQARELGILKPLPPKVWRKGEPEPVQQPQLKVWRRGESNVDDARKRAEQFLSGQGFKTKQEPPTTDELKQHREYWQKAMPTDTLRGKLTDLLMGIKSQKIDEAEANAKQKWTREQIEQLAKEKAAQYNVPWPLVKALMKQESGTSVKAGLTSTAGAIGPMQLMPGTAAVLKVNPYDIRQNVDGGVRFLAQNYEKYRGNLHHVLSAYNAGPYATDKWLSGESYYIKKDDKPILVNPNKVTNPTGAPWKETINYQKKIIGNLIGDQDAVNSLQARAEELGGNMLAQMVTPAPVVAKTEKTVSAPAADKEPKEFKQGYYAVGDSHAEGIAKNTKDENKRRIFTNLGKTSSSAFSPQHIENIKKIPAGSVVTISLGANDLGSKKLSDIVDQVNKTIAASEAQGHKVVYMLPTETTDPRLQKKREDLRQALLQNLSTRNIIDLGIASDKDPQKVHLAPKGYGTMGQNVAQSFTPGVEDKKPATATANKKDDRTFLQKATDIVSPQTAADPRMFSVAASVPFLGPTAALSDVLQKKLRSFLASKEEPAKSPAPPAPPAPAAKKDTTTTTKSADAAPKAPVNQPLFTLEKEKREREQARQKNLPMQPPSFDPELDPKGWEEYSDYMEKRQIAAGDQYSREREARLAKDTKAAEKSQVEKPAEKSVDKDVSSLLQKDQTGLKTAYKGSVGAQAIMQQNPDIIKDINRIRAGEVIKIDGQNYTIKPGDTLDKIARKMKPSVQAVAPKPAYEPEVVAGTQTTDRFQPAAPEPEPPAKSEIQQAMRDFDRKQTMDRLMQQADELVSTPAPRTPEELASDELWKDIRAHAAGKTPEELSAAAKQAMQDLDAELQSQTPTTNAPGAVRDLGTITIGEPKDEYQLPIDDREKQRQKADMDAELKESINTQSRAELHDILRLAGRLK